MVRTANDMRAYKFATENREIEAGARGPQVTPKSAAPLPAIPKPSSVTLPAAQTNSASNNALIKAVRAVTLHEAQWVYACCRRHGGTEPENTRDIWGVIIEMCGDFAVRNRQAPDIDKGKESINNAIAIARSAGIDPLQAALSWLDRHRAT